MNHLLVYPLVVPFINNYRNVYTVTKFIMYPQRYRVYPTRIRIYGSENEGLRSLNIIKP